MHGPLVIFQGKVKFATTFVPPENPEIESIGYVEIPIELKGPINPQKIYATPANSEGISEAIKRALAERTINFPATRDLSIRRGDRLIVETQYDPKNREFRPLRIHRLEGTRLSDKWSIAETYHHYEHRPLEDSVG